MSTLKSFSQTKIAVASTQDSLDKLLEKRGIKASRWTHFSESGDEPGVMRFEFEWQPPQQVGHSARAPLGFRIEVGYKGKLGPYGGQQGTTREQAARALYWHVKNLFDAIDFGIVDLEEAFMPYLLTAGGTTAYQELAPRLAELAPADMPRLLTGGR